MQKGTSRVSARLLIASASCWLVLSAVLAAAKDSGYRVSYRLENASLGLGLPVMADVNIENTSSQPVDMDLGGDANENIRISVIRPEGQRIDRSPADRRNRVTFFGGIHLDPGQTYSETLVLNRWFDFGETGDYVINIGLKSEQAPATLLHLEVRARDAAETAALCSGLVSRIQANASAQDSIAAIQALRYVRDPVAVSSWEILLHRRDLIMTAISGLTAIGDLDAAKVLISRLDASDESTRLSIRSALQTIATNTSDEGIKREITNALREKK